MSGRRARNSRPGEVFGSARSGNPITTGSLGAGSRFSVRHLLEVLPLLLLVSCSVGPNYRTPRANVEAAWTTPTSGTTSNARPVEGNWWKALGDPVLDGLIQVARTNNLSLQIAGVRILEARARLNKSVGNLLPQQQGISGNLDYRRLNDPITARVPSFTPDFSSDQVLFASTWEIDVWGKFRRGIESDRAGYMATVASYDDALVTLNADVASVYLNIRTTEERLRVAGRNVELLKESLRVAQAQFEGGETSERDVRQASTVLAQTEAGVPQLEHTLHQARNALAVLIGETPDKVDRYLGGETPIPTAPATVAVGIPKDLLRRRPDVREAEFNAASQCALIGVARAQMYPSFSLSGAFGFSANGEGKNSLADMFNWQSRAVKAGASFLFPIFNYGRLINQVRVQDAQFEQAILNYQNTVLAAQQEVENGLSLFAAARQTEAHLQTAAESARRSTKLALTQYKEGETDFTTVLSTEQAQLSVDDSLASARGDVVQGLISVYRALGGGWEIRRGNDVISDTVKSEMAGRTSWGRFLDHSRDLPGQAAANLSDSDAANQSAAEP